MANIQNFYDYELTYTGKYINEFLGTNAIDTVDYYADLNDRLKVSDARITGYETEEKTSQDNIPPEHSKIFYVINGGRIDETTGKIIDVDGVEAEETDINGKKVATFKYKRGFYQFIGYWHPTLNVQEASYTLDRHWKYIEELSDGGKVFPKGYTAPTQMGLIETGDDIGNKTMKQLFIEALGKDGWQYLPTFSYSTINYLDSTGTMFNVFNSPYQIGSTLDIYGLAIKYTAADGKYLSTSNGTFIVPVIGSTANGNYNANTLSSGKGKTYSITPTDGIKSGTITLEFSSQETYSLTKIGSQIIVSSITGTQSYIDPSDSNKTKTINITGTTKSINVGQYPVYYAYLTEDPSANSTIPTNNVDKIQKTLQTSKLSDNIEFTVPDKTITKASYLYIFVSTLISETTCTLSIINPDKTSAAKLDKLEGQVIISTGSTGTAYNKFYAFRVSNQTSGNAYSKWYIKYNKK